MNRAMQDALPRGGVKDEQANAGAVGDKPLAVVRRSEMADHPACAKPGGPESRAGPLGQRGFQRARGAPQLSLLDGDTCPTGVHRRPVRVSLLLFRDMLALP